MQLCVNSVQGWVSNNGLKMDHSQIQDMLHKIDVDQKDFFFSGHAGIRENEAPDRAAKEALDREPTDDLIPFSDLKSLTAKYVRQIW